MPKLLNKHLSKTPTFVIKQALSHNFRYPICTVNSIGGNSEIGRAKFQVKTSKLKNMVYLFLAKSKLFVKSSSELGFFTIRAKLGFAKLKQAFIKIPIIYYFDPKCYMCIRSNLSDYSIDKVLSQLTLNVLDQ